MNRIPRARYTKEVREEAVSLAKAVGTSEASRRLSIPPKTLANWLRAANVGKLAEVGKQQTYIDLFYNRQRRQERLGYPSPVAFIQQYYRQQSAA